MQARSVAPEPTAYHRFADHRSFLGIPNFADVASNLRFAVIALWGARVGTGLEVAVVIFEALTVLVLRAHSTMDVFTGLGTGLYAARLAEPVSG